MCAWDVTSLPTQFCSGYFNSQICAHTHHIFQKKQPICKQKTWLLCKPAHRLSFFLPARKHMGATFLRPRRPLSLSRSLHLAAHSHRSNVFEDTESCEAFIVGNTFAVYTHTNCTHANLCVLVFASYSWMKFNLGPATHTQPGRISAGSVLSSYVHVLVCRWAYSLFYRYVCAIYTGSMHTSRLLFCNSMCKIDFAAAGRRCAVVTLICTCPLSRSLVNIACKYV